METPLWQASYVGDARIVGALLADERLGVYLNFAAVDGTTPLYIASWKGHAEVVSLSAVPPPPPALPPRCCTQRDQAERKMDSCFLGILSQIIVLNITKISTSILVENLEEPL